MFEFLKSNKASESGITLKNIENRKREIELKKEKDKEGETEIWKRIVTDYLAEGNYLDALVYSTKHGFEIPKEFAISAADEILRKSHSLRNHDDYKSAELEFKAAEITYIKYGFKDKADEAKTRYDMLGK
ncbi:MAG: hypothetical protein WA139_02135 [Candidatus Aenigmatarchaeota archaeon]